MEFQDRRVKFLALDAWDGNIGQVGSFITASSISYPVLMRASNVANTLYGLRHDSVFVIGGDGIVGFADARGFSPINIRAAIEIELEKLAVPVRGESFGAVKALFVE